MRTGRTNWMLRGLVALGFVAAVGVVWFAWQRVSLPSRFSQIYVDETEEKLLKVVGTPTRTLRCDEGRRKIQPSTVRPCARVRWYSAYPFDDGWLIPIDEQGTIMQINRLAPP